MLSRCGSQTTPFCLLHVSLCTYTWKWNWYNEWNIGGGCCVLCDERDSKKGREGGHRKKWRKTGGQQDDQFWAELDRKSLASVGCLVRHWIGPICPCGPLLRRSRYSTSTSGGTWWYYQTRRTASSLFHCLQIVPFRWWRSFEAATWSFSCQVLFPSWWNNSFLLCACVCACAGWWVGLQQPSVESSLTRSFGSGCPS